MIRGCWGLGPGAARRGTRTVFISGGNLEDYDADLHQFLWLFSFNGKMLSLSQFVTQVNILPGMRNIVTFGTSVGSFRRSGQPENLEAEIRDICAKATEDAKRLAKRNEKQSADDRACGPAQPSSSSAHRSRSWIGHPAAREIGLRAGGGEGRVHPKGALLRIGSNLMARRMCVVHFECAVDVVEFQRVATPAGHFQRCTISNEGGVDSLRMCMLRLPYRLQDHWKQCEKVVNGLLLPRFSPQVA